MCAVFHHTEILEKGHSQMIMRAVLTSVNIEKVVLRHTMHGIYVKYGDFQRE